MSGKFINFAVSHLLKTAPLCSRPGRYSPRGPKKSREPDPAEKSPPAGGDASVRAAVATAPIAFDEGQRRYGRTEVEPVEDPSMNAPRSQANERAYSDDAKAFASR